MAEGHADREATPGVAPVEDDVAVVMQLEVEGEAFELRPDEFGGTQYTWVNGPNPGYGFSMSPAADSVEQHRENILSFLAMIDPKTGYIEDD
jgi:hypothetical protein